MHREAEAIPESRTEAERRRSQGLTPRLNSLSPAHPHLSTPHCSPDQSWQMSLPGHRAGGLKGLRGHPGSVWRDDLKGSPILERGARASLTWRLHTHPVAGTRGHCPQGCHLLAGLHEQLPRTSVTPPAGHVTFSLDHLTPAADYAVASRHPREAPRHRSWAWASWSVPQTPRLGPGLPTSPQTPDLDPPPDLSSNP